MKKAVWNPETNIFTDIFTESILRINPELRPDDVPRLLNEISRLLDYEDLGKAFYEKLVNRSVIKLIDFGDFNRNSFHVVTELPYQKGDEVFRPDITLLINGMPLVFVEVKKPNNQDGIQAEKNRMDMRFSNSHFWKFANLTQLMIFSNNMEYVDGERPPLQGAFYATPSYNQTIFNYFREEEDLDLSSLLQPENEEIENRVLKDNNLVSIKNQAEFKTAKDSNSPTSRICTSLLSRERLAFFLCYGITYVWEEEGLEKHVMRYPQYFAARAIENVLNSGIRKGIIWHTQGSGKTALASYCVKFLTDYYTRQGIVPKFYFIVDRLDLADQAAAEFGKRSLFVQRVESRDDFAKTIKSPKAIENDSGVPEITVVNIQKFKDDPDVARNSDYNLNLQRIYFLDEVHRSYNPQGSFLANLRESDPNSIKIGLTGTPLLGNDYNSKTLFGDYIHKYYYNRSIADGYTLRLIREDIETSYKLVLAKALEELEILKGAGNRQVVFSHPRFVEPMLDYIIEDLENDRHTKQDNTIGAMVVCDSSDQAKEMFRIFQERYQPGSPKSQVQQLPQAAEMTVVYREGSRVNSAALILHDVDSKKEREDRVKEFRNGKIDILFVYNMLLTGFNAPRLKKIYLGRVIRSHNLLQCLTRVNRPYHEFQFGYVVDFADIRNEFEKTNKAYFDELQSELGDEMKYYSDLFLTAEEIDTQIGEIAEALFEFDLENGEIFSRQISEISDRKRMLEIVKALEQSRNLYNVIRSTGAYDKLEQMDFRKLSILHLRAKERLALINAKEALEGKVDGTNLLKVALEEVVFAFTLVGREEMLIADQLKNTLKRTREALLNNMDPKDPEFITLKEELERLFKKKNLSEVTQADMESNIKELDSIHLRAKKLEMENQLLRAKYLHDAKYARVHKRILEKGNIAPGKVQLSRALMGLKEVVDEKILQNAHLLENESYVTQLVLRLVMEELKIKAGFDLNADSIKFINNLVVREYLDEFYGRSA